MTETDTSPEAVDWPREIWMAELDEHHNGTGMVVLSEFSTVPRWEGDDERDREFNRYVDANIYDSAEKYWQARQDDLAARLAEVDAERHDLARRCAAYDEMAEQLNKDGGPSVLRRQMELRRAQVRADAAEAKLAKAREVADYLIRAFDHINEAPRRGPVDDVYLLVKTGSAIASVSDARAALALIDADTPAPEAVETRWWLVWFARPRPPVHPAPMRGIQPFGSAKDALEFFDRCAPDAEFVSLKKKVSATYPEVTDLAALRALAEGGE